MMQFNACWTQIDQKRKDKFFARDFMCWEPSENAQVWWLALEDWMIGQLDMGGYEIVDFEGGLYAAAVCDNSDPSDFARAYEGIGEWIAENQGVVIDDRLGHRVMNHVICTDLRAGGWKDRQAALYVPIQSTKAMPD
ncbi:MAG: hypothetical protein LBN04_07190 [Oscillospiraceae bacterium]|nr:hypothetical protein [Oscillospiraceae bacterium]